MHIQAEAIGKLVRPGDRLLGRGLTSRALRLLEKEITNIQIDVGLPIHNETTVDGALKAGLKGDKDAFDRLYRAALPSMDEQISTATMFYVAKGAGKVKMDEQQWKQFAYSFRIASRMRLETEYTGYSTDDGEVQHPTSVGSEFFSSSGKGHTYWDRARREDVLSFGETTSSTGVDEAAGHGRRGRPALVELRHLPVPGQERQRIQVHIAEGASPADAPPRGHQADHDHPAGGQGLDLRHPEMDQALDRLAHRAAQPAADGGVRPGASSQKPHRSIAPLA